MLTQTIDKYEIKYLSNGQPRTIWLTGGSKIIGVLAFHHDAGTLSGDRSVEGRILLHYHLHDFANILHILEHEKPVYLFYTGPNEGDANGIITGNDRHIAAMKPAVPPVFPGKDPQDSHPKQTRETKETQDKKEPDNKKKRGR